MCLQFIGGLARFWEVRGYLREGLEWLTQALELKRSRELTKARADAILGGGDLAYLQCNYELARSFYEEAFAIYQKVGDQKGAGHALVGLGEVATETGDYDAAPVLFHLYHDASIG